MLSSFIRLNVIERVPRVTNSAARWAVSQPWGSAIPDFPGLANDQNRSPADKFAQSVRTVVR
ncbi:hypothetical protein ABZW03_00460 [Kitasatospora sp. NPDC004799]|uniref:hypothetical protein n=1 Tax=Kitasatospora sp. NPDC004799 TaxID=3154460 RepID=UPI0033BD18FA